jgi:hypothetical protein
MVVTGIDGGDDRVVAILADQRRRVGGQRGDADDRPVGGKADAPRRGPPDATIP